MIDKYKMGYEEEQERILTLWHKYLANDKRSFIEYFQEEHNIKIAETTSYKKIKRLCKIFLKGKN
tara:strand:+ start:278 stop:472 length:195 start_codon:yes stop_codon:yes gene_type:complete